MHDKWTHRVPQTLDCKEWHSREMLLFQNDMLYNHNRLCGTKGPCMYWQRILRTPWGSFFSSSQMLSFFTIVTWRKSPPSENLRYIEQLLSVVQPPILYVMFGPGLFTQHLDFKFSAMNNMKGNNLQISHMQEKAWELDRIFVLSSERQNPLSSKPLCWLNDPLLKQYHRDAQWKRTFFKKKSLQ